ncbi:MAG: dephospho-CoA kinase [Planctomycetota bacterium]
MSTDRTVAPFTIGLLGGIASGKSFVAALLAERGAKRFDADRIAHQVLDAEDVREAIRLRFGSEVFAEDGFVDRSRMAARVFENPAARAELESLIHPRVGVAIMDGLAALRTAPGERREVAVLDVPLLLEAGLDGLCNELWYIDTDFELRLRRAATRGWTQGELERRESSQASVNRKRARADVVVPNQGDEEATRAVVQKLWERRVDLARGVDRSPKGETP